MKLNFIKLLKFVQYPLQIRRYRFIKSNFALKLFGGTGFATISTPAIRFFLAFQDHIVTIKITLSHNEKLEEVSRLRIHGVLVSA